jgi:hypothetical protein
MRRVMAEILGQANVRNIDAEKLSSRFNEFMAQSQLLVLEEVERVGRRESTKLKGYITDTVTDLELKNQSATQIPNRVNFLLFSNDPRPVHLDTDDRRYMVYESPAKQNAELATEFYRWAYGGLQEVDQYGTMDYDRSGFRAIKHRLERLDMADFEPLANAPVTRAKERLQERSLSEVAQAIKQMEDEQHQECRSDIIIPRYIAEFLASNQHYAGRNISTAKVQAAMLELGWERLHDYARHCKTESGQPMKVRFWARRNAAYWRDKTGQQCYDHYQELRDNPRKAEAYNRGLHDVSEEFPF